MNKNMILVSSTWDKVPTFKLIPASLDTPYNEGIYDPTNNILHLISKEKKPTYHFLPKLNDDGDMMLAKKPRAQKQPYAEQRVLVDTYYEYSLTDQDEILSFINEFAMNSDKFDIDRYTTHSTKQLAEIN